VGPSETKVVSLAFAANPPVTAVASLLEIEFRDEAYEKFTVQLRDIPVAGTQGKGSRIIRPNAICCLTAPEPDLVTRALRPQTSCIGVSDFLASRVSTHVHG